jgi:hypothetical protein
VQQLTGAGSPRALPPDPPAQIEAFIPLASLKR